MKIDTSAVTMTSNRKYTYIHESTTTLSRYAPSAETAESAPAAQPAAEEADSGVKLELANNNKEPKSMAAYTDKILSRARDKVDGIRGNVCRLPFDQELSLLEQMLNALEGKDLNTKRFHRFEPEMNPEHSADLAELEAQLSPHSSSVKNSGSISRAAGYTYTQDTLTLETEYTSFSAQGIAVTEDGRQISFNVGIEMSRAFVEQTSTQITINNPELCDPLVVNLGAGVTSVSDQKFVFDINADGNKDTISQLSGENGFLALDKNADGVINDGSELFGAKTGDGFAELSVYDEDGNGWIDENDSVFKDLRVWAFNEDGSSRLVALLDADVGAIYLGNVGTQFSLNDSSNNTNAVIRNTGVFLKESGGVETVQHVDFAL